MKKLGELEFSKEIQNIIEDNLLVSYDFNSLYPSAQIDLKSPWPKVETDFRFENFLSNSICCLFNSRRWNELKTSVFLTVKFHNRGNLIFQHVRVRKKN